MAYEKQEWKDRSGENLNKFAKSQETETTVVLTNAPDAVSEGGTPFTAGRMNHIEDGIESAHEAIAIEEQNRQTAEQALQEKINAEKQGRLYGDDEIRAAVSGEAQEREEADRVLQEQIDALSPESLERITDMAATVESLPVGSYVLAADAAGAGFLDETTLYIYLRSMNNIPNSVFGPPDLRLPYYTTADHVTVCMLNSPAKHDIPLEPIAGVWRREVAAMPVEQLSFFRRIA